MKYAVLDFETTGDQPNEQVIQAGLVIIDDNQITQTYTSFINPQREIPPFITQLTGITNDMVADAPLLGAVLEQMQPLLADSVLVAHHVTFDLSFLRKSQEACGIKPFDGRALDTIDALRILFPELTSLQLSMVSSTLGVAHERPHQADSDALATAEIWLKCMQRLDELPFLTIQRLASLWEREAYDFGWFLKETERRRELETSIDLHAYRYFRQFALNVEDWANELPAREETGEKIDPDTSFDQFFQELKLSLQQQFNRFEERTAQDTMIGEVYEAFAANRHLMVEAGTGTGKSLGYLIPALYYGIRHGKKVLISTHTINLQEQLRQRDLPLMHDIFPVPFRASILKGRNHYLCLRKLEQRMNHHDGDVGRDELVAESQLIVWLGETMHGDEEEIHFGNKGNEVWRTVASDSDSCLNRSCPWFKKCFYHRARHEANIADVVITNHSLLFTDIKAENRLLPFYEELVIDEAHHFEEVAGKHLGLDVQYYPFVNSLTWLYKDSKTGQLPMLRMRLQRFIEDKTLQWCSLIDTMLPKLVSVKEDWDRFAELMFTVLSRTFDPSQAESGQFVLRLKADHLPPEWQELVSLEENIYLNLTEVLRKLDKLSNQIKEEKDSFDLQSTVTDLAGTIKDLYRHRDSLRFFVKMEDSNYVYWAEAGTYYRSRSLQLYCVPIDVSHLLREYFFSVKESIIMTSATLSVDKSFHYACEQFGLNPDDNETRLKTVQLPSPFNYRRQALVMIPRDFPTLRGGGAELSFTEKLVESLRDVAIETKGRMLVLFTSYKMMKQTYAMLKEQLHSYGIHVIGQGQDSGNRSKLTRLFQESPSSVLLGTSSFWEGVDIPGDALSCLAIVRLPFQPPNHPLIEAKTEQLKKQNKNAFMKLSVPQAVIKFKQGFGRLVRTTSDKGIVIVYDTRVIDTNYGKYFLYSLPGPKIEHMPLQQMVPRIKDWMEANDR